MGFGLIGIKGDGLMATAYRIIKPSLFLQGRTQVGMIGGLVRIGANGFLYKLNGAVVAADLLGDQPHQMIGIAMVGFIIENLAVKRFRFAELAGTVRLDSLLDNFVEKFFRDTNNSLGRTGFLPARLAGYFLLLAFLCSIQWFYPVSMPLSAAVIAFRNASRLAASPYTWAALPERR